MIFRSTLSPTITSRQGFTTFQQLMSKYSLATAFKTLLGHLQAHPFDLAQTVKQIEEMSKNAPRLAAFLNQKTIPFPEFVTQRPSLRDLAGKDSKANHFFLIPYLVALYEFRHLNTPYRSMIQTDEPASGTGFQASDLHHILEALLKVGVNINATFPQEDTALHLAAEANDLPLVSFLMQRGADPSFTNILRQTPVHLATAKNQLDLVRQFLTQGIPADFRANATDKNSHPLIIMAGIAHHTPMLELLTEYGALMNIDPPDSISVSPLLATLLQRGSNPTDKLKAIAWLLEHGADANAMNAHGQGILHEAVVQSRMDIAELLVQHGADVNLLNGAGYTALHIAALRGHLEFSSFLLSHGSDLELLSDSGQTALYIAKDRDDASALTAFLENATLVLREKKELSKILTPIPSSEISAQGQPLRVPSKRQAL